MVANQQLERVALRRRPAALLEHSASSVARLFLRKPRGLDFGPLMIFGGAFFTGALGIFNVGPHADYYAFVAAPFLTVLGWAFASITEKVSTDLEELELKLKENS